MKHSIFNVIITILVIAALIVGGVMLFRSLSNNRAEPPTPSNNFTPPTNPSGEITSPDTPVEPPHVHFYLNECVENAYLASPATCLSPATYYYLCSCGEVGTDTYEVGTVTAHAMVNGFCSVCHRGESAGLIFTPNAYDEQDPNAIRTCTLSGIGSCLDTDLVIPALSPDGMTVTHISASAFENDTAIECVTFPSTLKEIGSRAFENATALHTVHFAADGALTKIGTNSFASCAALEAIALPEGLTHLGKKAFFECRNLNQLTIPSTLETIAENTFAGCQFLSQITLAEGVKTIDSNAFDSCSCLASIDLPDTLAVIGDHAFAQTAITQITIPANVREIHTDTFSGCIHLATITVHADNATYISVDGALYRKSDYALIIYPYAKDAAVLVLPDGMTTIFANTFAEHQELISVSIPASVTKIEDGAFFGCSQLKNVSIPANSALTEIGKDAFSHCKSLERIHIPGGITEIGDSAFLNCTSLSMVTIPYGVTTIGPYAFSGCEALERIDIPDSVTTIEAFAFKWTGLKNVTLSRYVSVCEGAFIECQQLTAVTVAADNPYYKSVDGVLYSADGKHLVVYPAGKTNKTFAIPFGVETVGSFTYCKALESVYIPASVNNLGSGFAYCTNLKAVTFDENCNISTLSDTFQNCTALTSIVIPKSVTYISFYTFANCTNLVSVTVPVGIIEIGSRSFSGCQGLSTISFEGTIRQWTAITFGYAWDENTGNYTVDCSDGVIVKPTT